MLYASEHLLYYDFAFIYVISWLLDYKFHKERQLRLFLTIIISVSSLLSESVID